MCREEFHTWLHVIESPEAQECHRCCPQSLSCLAPAWKFWVVSPEWVGQGEVGYPWTCDAGNNGRNGRVRRLHYGGHTVHAVLAQCVWSRHVDNITQTVCPHQKQLTVYRVAP